MPDELTMIYYFQENLKLFIKIKIEQQNRKSVNFEKLIQKSVNAKAIAGLKSIIMVQDSDLCCSQGHCLSNSITSKMQTEKITTKDFSRPQKLKIKDLKSILSHNNIAELAKKENK